ncbi:hypothetical protein [Streptomyces sp. 8N706]|uniref:hypothetical protein n=1 Tax=Streptomyces sp. 8N706 TaxID=3457416 RepID=UPI003FD31589
MGEEGQRLAAHGLGGGREGGRQDRLGRHSQVADRFEGELPGGGQVGGAGERGGDAVVGPVVVEVAAGAAAGTEQGDPAPYR